MALFNTVESNTIVNFLELGAITIIAIIILNFTVLRIKKRLLQKAKSKDHISRIKIFTRLLNIALIWIVILFAFLTYFKSWTGIGVVAGLLTAAVGFALQKPITGIAAWIMVAVNRPFRIGDRISIGTMKGDVYDISLTHVFIDEIDSSIDTEIHSGRNVMIPNYKLFEEVLVNHTLLHDFVLDEVTFTIRYDSDVEQAVRIAKQCAKAVAGHHNKKIKKEIAVRVTMVDTGLKLRVLFFAPVQKLSQVKTEVTKNIYQAIKKEKKVNFAFNKLDNSIKK